MCIMYKYVENNKKKKFFLRYAILALRKKFFKYSLIFKNEIFFFFNFDVLCPKSCVFF